MHRLILFIFISIVSSYVFSQSSVTIETKRNEDNSVSFYYEKLIPGNVTVLIHFPTLENSHAGSFRGVVSNNSGILTRLTPIDKKKPIKYSYVVSTIRGVVDPKKVDSLFVYLLPFAEGAKVTVAENSNVSEKYFDNEKKETWKSYSFRTQGNDTVFSARQGVVIKVADEYDDKKLQDKKYTSKNNYILIEHEDGTIARYAGISRNGICVKEGDVVTSHTPMALLAKDEDGENFRLIFAVYYQKFDQESENPKKYSYRYIVPYFLTEHGVTRLEPKKEFTVVLSEDILNKEVKKKKNKKK